MSEALQSTATRSKFHVFGNGNFRLLAVSAIVVSIGDALTFIAYPWLVLQLSDSAIAMGTIIAIEALPRALFILVGGAYVDKWSPKTTIIFTRLCYIVCIGTITVLILTETVELWMVYINAFIVGVVSAFGIPAINTFLPQLVDEEDLSMGNSTIQGTSLLAFLAGPAAAGFFMTWMSGSSTEIELFAIGSIFVVHLIALALATLAIVMIQVPQEKQVQSEDKPVHHSLKEGFRYIWNDRDLFLYFGYMGVQSCVMIGTIFIGFPILANEKLDHGVASHGMLLSALGAGMLLGIIIAGVAKPPPPRYFGTIMIGIGVIAGPFYAALGLQESTVTAMILIGCAAPLSGYSQIVVISWIQKRVEQDIMGRVMSMFSFLLVGIAPLAALGISVLIELYGVDYVIIAAGALMTLLALGCVLHPRMRRIGASQMAN